MVAEKAALFAQLITSDGSDNFVFQGIVCNHHGFGGNHIIAVSWMFIFADLMGGGNIYPRELGPAHMPADRIIEINIRIVPVDCS